MPDYLIKNVRIVDENEITAPKDLLISEGRLVREFTSTQTENATQITGNDLYLINGLIDVGTTISEPGYEWRETLEQTCAAAIAGGFSTLITLPGTLPVTDSRADIEFFTNRSEKNYGVRLFPMGALTKGLLGDDLAELMDMNAAGAVAFTEGSKPVDNGGVLLRAMDYIRGFKGLIVHTPYDPTLFPTGQIHEGVISTMLGMTGIPEIAEDIIVDRDLALVQYTGCRLHFSYISTIGSIKKIKKAKAAGLPITCGVSINNLLYNVEELTDYNTNLKLLPPLRNAETTKALWEAVKDGTIDVIATQHTPLEPEKKDLEFQYAGFGALGLQTAIPSLLTKYHDNETWQILRRTMYQNPAKIFGIEKIGATSWTIIDNLESKIFTKNDLLSNCYNSPVIDKPINYSIRKVII